MKKKFTLITLLFLLSGIVFAQTNITVDINDDVYLILRNAEISNLCTTLETAKPFTQTYITKKLYEILDNLNNKNDYKNRDKEIAIIQSYIDKFHMENGVFPSKGAFRFEEGDEENPISLQFNFSLDGFLSGGLYQQNSLNSYGYELYNTLDFKGDLGKNVSYRIKGYLGITGMPLQYMGDYIIGKWWYNQGNSDIRTIKSYRNNSVLPYSYNHFWDGSIYYLTNLTATGLEGWPVEMSLAFGMMGDLFTSLLDGKVELGINRVCREWDGMDEGSSLVLNANARPFMGFESRFHLFDCISLSSVTGIMEFPNQDYINDNALYTYDAGGNKEEKADYYFYQNAFSMAKFDLHYKRLYADFGSSCIWPKRFELGYAYPFLDRVIYQNSLGDYDNLALFGNIKYTQPGIGSVWFSAYLDEVSKFKIKFWEMTRAMYAYQVGTKINIPFLPFTTLSFRYTKIEPYCYTHQAINYTSWYDHYISESYTNNGYGLGYYLNPNSDEFHLRLETLPTANTKFYLQYQLVRHGAEWGSGAVPGSSLYSEMDPDGATRDTLTKYFLRDGTYEWSNIITLYGSYQFNTNIPVKLYASIGYVYDWFTAIEGTKGKTTPYHYINNSEYNDKNGVVLSIGFELF